MKVYPTKLERAGDDGLLMEWSDGQKRRYTVRQLRDQCPCATCREKRSAPKQPTTMLPVLSMEDTQPMRIAGMKPVGTYAYSIVFSDGHDSGIYTFEQLRSLGEEVR